MAVGENGKVYAQNDEVIWRFAEKGMIERSKNNRLANLVRFDAVAISAIDIPDNSLDIVFTALNYHDLFFTYTLRDGKRSQVREEIVDHKAALARIKKAMKDGGIFVIIDHAAEPGSGYEVANTLHRIDPNIVKYQMDEAGFKLIEEAFYLRNPQDDLTKGVFDTNVRGRTDRFIYKFSKK
jgi:predicted methyltransferase